MDKKIIKILMVEDNQGDARLIREMLIDVKDFSFNLECAGDLITALSFLSKGGIHIVLLDLSLPDSQGLETFDRASAQGAEVPVIILTGNDDETIALRAVERGAQDYLVKGKIDSDLLVRSIRYAISRKQAEEALRQSKKELSIRDQISHIFLTLHDDELYAEALLVILKVMESKYGYFGYIDDDGDLVCPSMTRDIWDKCQMPDKDIRFPRKIWSGIWGKSLIEKKPLYSNETLHTPEGHISILKTLAMPIIYQGELIGQIVVANKETAYTEKDQELLKSIANHIAPVLHARLGKDKKERERMKLMDALKKALVKAEEADRLKSAFLANMSHEIRTPMNAIIGFTSLMLDDELAEEHREFLQDVKESGDLLLAIIDDILDLSKIDAGQFGIEQIPCSLKAVLKNAGSACQMIISHKEKNIALRESISDNISRFIIADPTRVQQIMNNLLSNAVKFTENGFIEYGVALKDENTLEFYVRDTGIGIPEDKQDGIFKPFQQADGTHTRKYGGTGLGLTISKKLVELMGGEIALKSKVGAEHGTTFYFTLPYRPGEVKETDEIEETKVLETKTGYTILVAEDDILNQSLARKILERAGYNVVVTNDGKEAISIYKTDASIDLILMDMQMPVLDGYDATKVIRNIETKEKKNKRIPIIALTAFAMEGDKEKCIDAGMDDYVAKPIRANELLASIEKMIGTPVLK